MDNIPIKKLKNTQKSEEVFFTYDSVEITYL